MVQNEIVTDEELMIRYQNGDEASFKILFERHGKRLFSYYKKRVSDSLASDLFQDFFQKLHKVRRLYKKDYPFLPWFFLLARQVHVDYLRKKESRLWMNDKTEEFNEMNFSNTDTDATLFDELELALGYLNQREKEVILKRYLKDWSFSEIAQSLETTESAVRQMVSRGLKRLKFILVQKKEEL